MGLLELVHGRKRNVRKDPQIGDVVVANGQELRVVFVEPGFVHVLVDELAPGEDPGEEVCVERLHSVAWTEEKWRDRTRGATITRRGDTATPSAGLDQDEFKRVWQLMEEAYFKAEDPLDFSTAMMIAMDECTDSRVQNELLVRFPATYLPPEEKKQMKPVPPPQEEEEPDLKGDVVSALRNLGYLKKAADATVRKTFRPEESLQENVRRALLELSPVAKEM